ncbi:MAG: hypothetical protein D3905_07105 [Candidatus Electrothrix sp. AS4_5]|jgi:hypothetical protein|nr:hypothetical protein [Candidatus Electrothrix gigas]
MEHWPKVVALTSLMDMTEQSSRVSTDQAVKRLKDAARENCVACDSETLVFIKMHTAMWSRTSPILV